MHFLDKQIAPPKEWSKFEDLCLALFKEVWNDPMAQKNGRKGQRQHGVDIYGSPSGNPRVFWGVQCKVKDANYASKPTLAELKAEIEKAESFEPKLAGWVFATTAPTDGALQRAAREISQERANRGCFLVQVLGWEDILAHLANAPTVIENFYPEHAPFFSGVGRSGDPPTPIQATPSVDVAEVPRLFGEASRLLLGWPQETNGHWIDRPELEVLRQKVTEEVSTPTILLGRPGSGKSAILARLGSELKVAGDVTLLALKADELPRDCTTLADLNSRIGCEVVDGIRRLAESRRVAVLIDQLDALADLMDQHSGRLHALLQLATSTCAIRRVSVLMSCREFEYQNDLRLSTLDAESVRLQVPSWEQVEPVLQASSVGAAHLTDEQREVLRIPQHLALFVRYAHKQSAVPIFSTYQALLDHAVRDVGERFGQSTVAAAEHIATTMAEDEELWVARVRFESKYLDEVGHLLASEFLVQSEDALSVAFRHQTMFDFLRARAFLSGTSRLADYVIASKQESLFVRPTLWSALAYLRGTDQCTYRREFRSLWDTENLRLHLRLLLVSHLAQLPDPDNVEAAWLLPSLSEPVLRRRALTAMAGSRGWFNRLKSLLGLYMTSPNANEVVFLLQRALPFARSDVLHLLKEHWLGKDIYCPMALSVLCALDNWDSDSTALATKFAEQAGRMAMDMDAVRHLVNQVAKTAPESAAQVFFACLAEWGNRIADPSELAALLQHGHHWYELDEPFKAAPAAFVKAGWQWWTETLERLATPASEIRHEYRLCPDLITFYDDPDTLPAAFESVMCGFADTNTEGFLTFFAEHKHSDLMLAQSLLARGLARVAATCPAVVVDYLVEDPRRLAIGDYTGQRRETLALIAAAMPSANLDDRSRLERVVLDCVRYREPGEDAKQRLRRKKYDREHRLRLLRAFPQEYLSANGKRLRQEEERALTSVTEIDGFSVRGMTEVKSPMSADQMAKAVDQDIVNLFEQLTDETEWGHPRTNGHGLVGGSIEASREFAEFAKHNPQRALRIISCFEATRQERPAGEALDALGKSEVAPEDLLACVRELDARGFHSEDFRWHVAHCLGGIAHRNAGLDDETCELVEGWITEVDSPTGDSGDGTAIAQGTVREQTEEAESHSLLWGMGGGGLLPRGNYPLLEALALGYLCRNPVDADGFLHVLERHVERRETTDVWTAMLLRYVVHLERGDRKCATKFLATLLDRHPAVIYDRWTVRFVLSALPWMPDSIIDRILEGWTCANWEFGPQAAGEIATVMLSRRQKDLAARDRIERYLSGNGYEQPVCQSLTIGMAHTLIEAARHAEFRSFAVPYLVRVIASADGRVARALHRLFQDDHVMRPDEHTERILEACLQHPSVLDAQRRSTLIKRLQSLLSVGWNPRLVCKAAAIYLDAREQASGRDAVGYGLADNQLVDVALTLHHMPETRTEGLELFERLMALWAYGVADKLTVLDRHPP